MAKVKLAGWPYGGFRRSGIQLGKRTLENGDNKRAAAADGLPGELRSSLFRPAPGRGIVANVRLVDYADSQMSTSFAFHDWRVLRNEPCCPVTSEMIFESWIITKILYSP